jgi:plastocyanin
MMLRHFLWLIGASFALLFFPFGSEQVLAQATVVINITPGGDKAQYIQEGETKQKPVTVVVGQNVRWVNKDQVSHTATSTMTVKSKALFETGYLDDGTSSKDILFDQALFQAAGGKPGGSVTLEYFCRVHRLTMRSSIILKAGGDPSTPAKPGAKVYVIEAISDGANHVWRPALTAGVKAGDIIEWRNANVDEPGQHSLGFRDWATAKDLLDVTQGDLPFDKDKGKTPDGSASSTRNTLFLRATLKADLKGDASIDFYCPVHGAAMSGQIKSTAPDAPDPQLPAAKTFAKYLVPSAPIGAFETVKVTDRKSDCYYAIAADINGDGKMDLVVSGLGEPGKSLSEVAWFENPTWRKHVIGYFDVPVALAAADVDGDGLMDVAITYDYGFCIMNCKAGSGKVAWLRNPGPGKADDKWQIFPIGKHMASHRIHFGNFSTMAGLQLLSVPVVGGADGKIHDPITIKVFSRPKNVLEAKEWPEEVVRGCFITSY